MVGSVRRLGARVRVAALAVAFGALVPSGCAPHTETRLGASEPRPTHGPGGGLVLEDAWARAATATWDADGAPSANGAVYLSIRNAGSQADRLTGAACGAAQTVEVHRSAMEDGVMRMRPAGEVEIPPHGRVALEPGGLHVMLIGLRHDLREGDVLPVTLRFAAAGDQTVRADVRPRSAASGTGTMASGSDPPVVMSTPAVRSRDVLFVIPRGTAAQQLRGEGGV
ncbi:MAG TPA: copper chaperone PCu(A)C, partial [Chloroflexota bacterium]|nr:copper chaperone PCu(A)C [Chloroflexota bacterium]